MLCILLLNHAGNGTYNKVKISSDSVRYTVCIWKDGLIHPQHIMNEGRNLATNANANAFYTKDILRCSVANIRSCRLIGYFVVLRELVSLLSRIVYFISLANT